MLIYQTKVDCPQQLTFENNHAANGGAVTLEDQSLVSSILFHVLLLLLKHCSTPFVQFNLFYGTSVVFQNNKAESVGGAILVNNPSISQDHELVYNSFCFLQYDVEVEGSTTLTPDHWVRNNGQHRVRVICTGSRYGYITYIAQLLARPDLLSLTIPILSSSEHYSSMIMHIPHTYMCMQNVSITFLNNTAVEAGAAIYAHELRVCLFTSNECQAGVKNSLPFYHSIFMESPPFTFV